MWLKIGKLAKWLWQNKKQIYTAYQIIKPVYKEYIEPRIKKIYSYIKKKPETPASIDK